MLQQMDGLRIEKMKLTLSFPLIDSAHWQPVNWYTFFAEGKGVLDQGFSRDLIEAHACNAGDRTCKAFVHHFLVEANDFKYLGSLI